ncbi:MAG: hypothetical protein ABIR71_05290, partial [Chthoniobacterales bacterium]
FFRAPTMQRDPVFVHNDYLQLLAEYGLLGVAGLGFFLAVHLRYGMRNFSRLGPKRVAASQRLSSNALALNVGALAAVTSFVVHSIFDFNLHIPANVLLLAFVFAVLANDGVMRERAPVAASPGQKIWRLAPAFVGLVLLIQGARLLPGEYFAERARLAVRDQQAGPGLLYAGSGLKYDPSNPDLHYYLGIARLLFADSASSPEAAASFRNAAITALERARALAPREITYGLELATALESAQRLEEATQVFASLLRLDPKSDSLRSYYEGHLNLQREQPPT